jgi:predicted Zn finger-like uncharacterized protein
MIVTCPGCSTRYLVDPRALGATGRRVRCANCANTWHQVPPEDAPRRIELPPFEPEAPIAGPRRPHERVQLPALPQRRGSAWTALAWVMVLAILVGIGVGAVWARDRIVQTLPATAALYQLIGLPVADATRGFELVNVKTNRTTTDKGEAAIEVNGELVNRSPLTRDAPKLRVTLKDNGDRELQHWVFTVSEERLLPGQTVPFHTSITEPNDATAAIEVAVVDGRG